MRYFALVHPEMSVELVKGDPSRLESAYAHGAFLVGFPSGPIANELSDSANDPRAFHYDYLSYGGKPILQLWCRTRTSLARRRPSAAPTFQELLRP
jgi:hypothetical protein